jgi:hypothetical protein
VKANIESSKDFEEFASIYRCKYFIKLAIMSLKTSDISFSIS